jgi:acetyl-CoA carboxylase biotin carboxyl carrier protein
MARQKKSTQSRKPQPMPVPSGQADKLYTDQVRHLVDLMVANDLTSLEIVNGDLKVSLGRGHGGVAPAAASAPAAVTAAPVGHAASAVPTATAAPAAPVENLLEIKSPMVGTFYTAPSPDSDPYVTAGVRITADTVVCIIEAMKVMNEIKAECAGTIVEVTVENGRPVEYGQVLFKVRP